MREALRRARRPLVAALIIALMLAVPGTAAAECRFVRAPFPQPPTQHPWFPGCFIVLVGWLLCLSNGGPPPTPDDPPGAPTVTPVEGVICYSCGD